MRDHIWNVSTSFWAIFLTSFSGNCGHRPVQYLNNVLEQDHRAIKRRVKASQHFRSFYGAWRAIAGYEAIHMIRKSQACWSAAGAKVGLLHRFILGLFAAT
jgi:transposase-like protein